MRYNAMRCDLAYHFSSFQVMFRPSQKAKYLFLWRIELVWGVEPRVIGLFPEPEFTTWWRVLGFPSPSSQLISTTGPQAAATFQGNSETRFEGFWSNLSAISLGFQWCSILTSPFPWPLQLCTTPTWMCIPDSKWSYATHIQPIYNPYITYQYHPEYTTHIQLTSMNITQKITQVWDPCEKTPTTYSTQNTHPMWPPQVLSKDPSYCEYMVNQVLTSDGKAEDKGVLKKQRLAVDQLLRNLCDVGNQQLRLYIYMIYMVQ